MLLIFSLYQFIKIKCLKSYIAADEKESKLTWDSTLATCEFFGDKMLN